MELGVDMFESTVEQQILNNNYQNKLSELKIPDPNSIAQENKIENVMKWPVITLGNIFSYILKKRKISMQITLANKRIKKPIPFLVVALWVR